MRATRHPYSGRPGPVAVAILAALATAACAAEVDTPPPGEQPAPPEPANVTVAATTAAPGSEVTVRASGFTPGSVVEIGIGHPHSEYSVVAESRADGQGRVQTSVEIPGWTNGGEAYVIVVTEPDHEPRASSEPFVVGQAGDRVRVHGELTDEGVECPALRGPFGTLYTLAVTDLEHGPGTEVMVEGTIAGASICQQGTTIEVESIQAH